jgi:hypothetical protein
VKRAWAIICVVLAALVAVPPVGAHEVRPAYLEISQSSAGSYMALWKQPTMGEFAVHLVPHLSNGWLDGAPADQYVSNGFLIRTWQIQATDGAANASVSRSTPLQGLAVTIEGLDETITDVFVRARLLDGRSFEGLVHPQAPRLTLNFGRGGSNARAGFLELGIDHILSGPDHLLFVLGLLLIVRGRVMLLKTVTGFTAGHSLTLAWATLGQFALPVPVLNTLIALSILILAPEVLRARRGGSSFTIRYPWVVAFGFGLLHGLGFASGLGTLGLEPAALILALLLFNLGVEIGQLAFVAGVLALRRALRLMEIRCPRALAAAPGYLIGVLGAAWTFQYGALMFGWTT